MRQLFGKVDNIIIDDMEKIENEILLVDKPTGISSYDVIRRLKRDLPKGQKIGHAGTLDPFATGLLIIMLGRATKRFQEFQQLKKYYEVEFELGYETDTLDRTGEVNLKVADAGEVEKITESKVKQALKKFGGKVQQVPPRFSAKKINGKRAYKLAREGKNFKLTAKTVEIYEIELLKFDCPIGTIRVVCSSGCYIRSIVRDLGRELGVYATATDLRRTQIGDFKPEINLEDPR